MICYVSLALFLYIRLKFLTYYTPFIGNRRKVINVQTGPIFWPTLYSL